MTWVSCADYIPLFVRSIVLYEAIMNAHVLRTSESCEMRILHAYGLKWASTRRKDVPNHKICLAYVPATASQIPDLL